MLSGIADHALELGTLVAGSADGAIDVLPDDAEPFALAIFLIGAKLEVYAVFGLLIGGKPRVDHGVGGVLLRNGFDLCKCHSGAPFKKNGFGVLTFILKNGRIGNGGGKLRPEDTKTVRLLPCFHEEV